jgi:ribosomal protein L13E
LSKQPQKNRKVPSRILKKNSGQPKKNGKVIPEKKAKIAKRPEKKIEKPIVKKDVPSATISRPLKHITKIRNGKGFSRSELLSVELDARKARRLGLRVDSRRTSKWDRNVNALKDRFTIPTVKSKIVKKNKTMKSQK